MRLALLVPVRLGRAMPIGVSWRTPAPAPNSAPMARLLLLGRGLRVVVGYVLLCNLAAAHLELMARLVLRHAAGQRSKNVSARIETTRKNKITALKRTAEKT